jgi:hypothetical protein
MRYDIACIQNFNLKPFHEKLDIFFAQIFKNIEVLSKIKNTIFELFRSPLIRLFVHSGFNTYKLQLIVLIKKFSVDYLLIILVNNRILIG